jgi:hypothetical protein
LFVTLIFPELSLSLSLSLSPAESLGDEEDLHTLSAAQKKVRDEIRKVRDLLEKYDEEIAKCTDGKLYTEAITQLQSQT